MPVVERSTRPAVERLFMTADDELLEAARLYLRAKRTTLWADFYVSEDKGIERAATWLVEQIRGVELVAAQRQDADRQHAAKELVDAIEAEQGVIDVPPHPDPGVCASHNEIDGRCQNCGVAM